MWLEGRVWLLAGAAGVSDEGAKWGWGSLQSKELIPHSRGLGKRSVSTGENVIRVTKCIIILGAQARPPEHRKETGI